MSNESISRMSNESVKWSTAQLLVLTYTSSIRGSNIYRFHTRTTFFSLRPADPEQSDTRSARRACKDNQRICTYMHYICLLMTVEKNENHKKHFLPIRKSVDNVWANQSFTRTQAASAGKCLESKLPDWPERNAYHPDWLVEVEASGTRSCPKSKQMCNLKFNEY